MGEWFLNHWVKYLVCVSEADEKFVKKLRIIDRKKIILIRNGIDIARFRVERGDIVGEKGRMGLRDMCVVTTIARLNPPKDFNTLLYGFASAVKGYENLQFFIVGNGPLRGEIEDRVKKLGLQNKVRLLGFREDIPRIIAVSDVIVLSSKWEGLPLVTLEAGAGEKPVIASNAEGIRETVIDGVTGCLFPVGDSKKLAEHIKELAVSRDKREKMGKAGLEFVEKNFKKEDMLGQYKKLYEAIY